MFKWFENMKISRKLILSFGSVFLLFLLIFGIINYILISNTIKRMVDSELNNIINNLVTICETNIDTSVKNHLRSTSEKSKNIIEHYYNKYKSGELKENEAYEKVKEIFLDPNYYKIGKTGYLAGVSSKGVLVIHPKSPGVDASRFDFMKKAMSMKNGYLEYMWKNEGETIERAKAGWLSYFEPWDIMVWASSYKDEFSYLIDMNTLRSKILSVKVGKTGYPFIMDSKGNLIIHPNIEGQNIYESKDSNGNYFIKEICTKKNGIIKYPWKNPGEKKAREKITYYKYLPYMDWIICIGAYYDEMYSPLHNQRNITILIILLSVVVIIFITLFISKIITNPIIKLMNSIKLLSEGDLTSRLNATSKDEIGELTRHFNEFIKNLNERIVTLKKASLTIIRALQDLTVTSKEIATTSSQQAAAVKEVVTTMEDSDALAKGIATKITDVARMSSETREYVEQGSEIIKSNLEKMNEIKQKNADTIAGIRALNEKINNIWEIVNIINDIADQTKIIAFNAELEASSAGEAGKNFEIVASEIRRLVDNTMASTREIKSNINEIQKASDDLIVASERATEKIKQGWELSNNVGKVFNEILDSAEKSTNSIEQIVLSIEQQTSAFGQILIAMKQISEGIDSFTVSTKSTSSASESLKQTSESLNQIVEKYKVDENI